MADNYTNVSISGYNANPPSDDGAQETQNEVAWSKPKEKLTDPLKTAIEAIDTNVDAAFTAVEANTPPGIILDYAGTTAPTGWLLCFGQSLNSVADPTLANLFSVIGVTYGGTGADAFSAPDLRGVVTAGKDNMGGSQANKLNGASGGVDGNTLGASGGSETHTLTDAELSSHSPGTTGGSSQGHTHTGGLGAVGTQQVQAGTGAVVVDSVGTANTGNQSQDHTHSGGSVGSDDPHNNVQPTFILNKIIKK